MKSEKSAESNFGWYWGQISSKRHGINEVRSVLAVRILPKGLLVTNSSVQNWRTLPGKDF